MLASLAKKLRSTKSTKTFLSVTAALVATTAFAPSAQGDAIAPARNLIRSIPTIGGTAVSPELLRQIQTSRLASAPIDETGGNAANAGNVGNVGLPCIQVVHCPPSYPNLGNPSTPKPPATSTPVCLPKLFGITITRCDEADLSGKTTDLSMSGKASARRIRVGKKVTYTLTVTNVSVVTASEVTITDELDGPGKIRLAKTTKGQCDSGDHDVTCEIATLAPGQTVTITVRAKGTGTGTGRIVNQASTEALDPEDSQDSNDDLAFKTRVLKRQ